MRYLLISGEGEYISLAPRLEREGHTVSVHIVSPKNQPQGTGIVSNLKTPRPLKDAEGVYNLSTIEWLLSIARPDVSIFDSPITSEMASRMSNAGRRVLGPLDLGTHPKSTAQGAWAALGWSDGNDIVGPIHVGRTYLRMAVGDVGPKTSPTGIAAQVLGGFLYGLITDSFKNTYSQLIRSSQYRGPVWLSFDYSEEASGIVEKSFNLGWHPLAFCFFENLVGSASSFLNNLTLSTPSNAVAMAPCVAAVRLSVPPWPYAIPGQPAPVMGLNDPILRHLWFEDLAKDPSGEYRTTGCSSSLGFVTARGVSLREATRRVYRTISNLDVENLQYRTDIGKDLSCFRQEPDVALT